MEEGHDMLNAVLLIAPAGEGAAYNRFRHLTGREGHLLLCRLPFLRLNWDNIFNLFLYGRKELELNGGKFRRRENGGLFARRLFALWIYL